MAGQQAADDLRLAAGAQGRAGRLEAGLGEPADQLGPAHQQVVDGVVQAVEFGAQGGEIARPAGGRRLRRPAGRCGFVRLRGGDGR